LVEYDDEKYVTATEVAKRLRISCLTGMENGFWSLSILTEKKLRQKKKDTSN
jgi:hypothetical protein